MKQLLTFLLLTIAGHGFGQQITAKTTGKLKTATAADMIYYKDHVYTVESRVKAKFGFSAKLDDVKQAYNVKVFSMQGQLVAEKILAGGEHSFGPVDPVFRIINDSLYLVYGRYANETISIFASKLNTTTMELSDEQKVLSFYQKNIGLSIFTTAFQDYNLGIASSPDESKIVFFWCNGDNTDFSYSVCDRQLSVIRDGIGRVQGLKTMQLDNMFISNDGGFYAGVKFKYYDGGGGAVIVCRPASPAVVVSITLNNANAGSVYVSELLADNKLNLAGLVLKDKLITGVYKATIDLNTNSFSIVSETDFPTAVFEKGSKEDYGISRKNKSGLLPKIKMKGYTLPDGTIVIAGDLNRTSFNGNYPLNLKGPLILSCFKKSGDPVLAYIPKLEYIIKEEQYTYYGHIYKGELLLFYDDAIENFERSAEEAYTITARHSPKTANICMRINGTGIVNKKIVAYQRKNSEAIYGFSDIIRVDEHLLFNGLSTRRFEYSNYKLDQSLQLISIMDN